MPAGRPSPASISPARSRGCSPSHSCSSCWRAPRSPAGLVVVRRTPSASRSSGSAGSLGALGLALMVTLLSVRLEVEEAAVRVELDRRQPAIC